MLLLLAVASAVIALGTTFALRQFLIGQLDNEVRATSNAFQRFPGPPPADFPLGPSGQSDQGNRGPRPPSLVARLDDGDVLAAGIYSRDGEVQPVPADQYPAIASVPVGGRPESRSLGELGDYRLVAVRRASGEVVVTGLSEGAVEGTIARLTTIEVVVTLLTLLGAGCGRRVPGRPRAAPAGTGGGHRGAGEPAAAGPGRGVAGRAGPRRQPEHRGRPGRCGAEPDARPRRLGAGSPPGQRDPAAPVHRRRQPRAAHAAGRDPRLRRAGPPRSVRGYRATR